MSNSQANQSDVVGPILLLGIGGMLWRAWDNILDSANVEYHSPSLDELDFTKPDSIVKTLSGHYKLVINCAGYTDVPGAESNEEVANQLNAAAVGWLADRCKQVGATLVHYSTDYVFDGKACSPYPVAHCRNPLSAYGRSKALGEQLLEQSGCDYLLIRTSSLYAPWGKNFVRTIARLVNEKPSLPVVDDQTSRPTSAEHLAGTTKKLLLTGARGAHHVTDAGECTWYEFACEIGRIVNSGCEITPCSSEQFPSLVARPVYSVLDLSKTEEIIGKLTHWKKNLADVLGRLEKSL